MGFGEESNKEKKKSYLLSKKQSLKKKENKNKTLKVPKPFFRGYKSGMDLSTKNFI